MDFAHVITHYGYLAITIGAVLEGEMTLILGGVAAQAGLLHWSGVVVAGAMGTLAANQVWFWVGKRFGQQLLERRPHYRNKLARVTRMLEERETTVCLCYRLLYGFRTIIPLVMGMKGVSALKFAVIDALAVLILFTGLCGFGYQFGEAALPLLGSISRYQPYLLFGVVALIVLWIIRTRLRARVPVSNG